MLFAGLRSVRMVKNCDLGLENSKISRPRSQFFTIRTSQPANNIYIFLRSLIAVIAVISDLTHKRGERVNSALY